MAKQYLSTTEAANYLISELKKHNFSILRYNSFSTNSIYLKLDYGMANSIRISDHRGYKWLSYRYNVFPPQFKLPRVYFDKKKYPRYNFSATPDCLDELIKIAVQDREEKIAKYGEDGYKYFMQKDKEKGEESAASFWKEAKEV